MVPALFHPALRTTGRGDKASTLCYSMCGNVNVWYAGMAELVDAPTKELTLATRKTKFTKMMAIRRRWLDQNIEKIQRLYPFAYKVYGPYLNFDGSRYQVNMHGKSKKTTVQYARLKIEVKLGRKLSILEEVDHVNRKPRDDRYDNLQLLRRGVHRSLDALRLKPIKVKCAWCKSNFELRKDQRTTKAMRGTKGGPFCSKQCSGSYGASVQANPTFSLTTSRGTKSYFLIEK